MAGRDHALAGRQIDEQERIETFVDHRTQRADEASARSVARVSSSTLIERAVPLMTIARGSDESSLLKARYGSPMRAGR
jgi:hypothetical protein